MDRSGRFPETSRWIRYGCSWPIPVEQSLASTWFSMAAVPYNLPSNSPARHLSLGRNEAAIPLASSSMGSQANSMLSFVTAAARYTSAMSTQERLAPHMLRLLSRSASSTP